MTQILYAKPIKEQIMKMYKKKGVNASVCIIQVGDNPASNKYIRNKMQCLEEVGIMCHLFKFQSSIAQPILQGVIKSVADNPNYTSMMIQLPLPKHLNEKALLDLIPVEKDVDCLSTASLGLTFDPNSFILPCTPKGILTMLGYYNINIVGADVCIVGRSNIVGASLGMALTKRGATVTICHSHTERLREKTRKADIVVCAVGKAEFFDSTYFHNDSIVIDVGINFNKEGKMCGDVDFENVNGSVKALSPVPGGVGVLTVCGLIMNATTQAADRV